MDSGYSTISSTYLNDMLTDFVDYVYSFYGDKKEALYPLFNVDNDKQVTKSDIICATYDYLHEVNKRNDDHFTWRIQLGDQRMELTHDEIRRASTAKLRNILKEDIDVELDDMINYELYIREFS